METRHRNTPASQGRPTVQSVQDLGTSFISVLARGLCIFLGVCFGQEAIQRNTQRRSSPDRIPISGGCAADHAGLLPGHRLHSPAFRILYLSLIRPDTACPALGQHRMHRDPFRIGTPRSRTGGLCCHLRCILLPLQGNAASLGGQRGGIAKGTRELSGPSGLRS